MSNEAIESSQRQHHEVMRHQEDMNFVVARIEFALFELLKPKLYRDGNEWCCLYGDDIVTGVVGFGTSPHKAVMAWNSAWHETQTPKS